MEQFLQTLDLSEVSSELHASALGRGGSFPLFFQLGGVSLPEGAAFFRAGSGRLPTHNWLPLPEWTQINCFAPPFPTLTSRF